MKTPDEQRIPVEAGKEEQFKSGARRKGIDSGQSTSDSTAQPEQGLQMPRPEPITPRIQAVIDAARALVDSIATRPWFRCEALTPLESALADLGEQQIKNGGDAKCGTTETAKEQSRIPSPAPGVTKGASINKRDFFCQCHKFTPAIKGNPLCGVCDKPEWIWPEPTKDDEWPRYWLRPDNHVVRIHIGRKGHTEGELWNGFQWVLHSCCWPDDMFKDKGYKRLTPAAAQARMEGAVMPEIKGAYDTTAKAGDLEHFNPSHIQEQMHLQQGVKDWLHLSTVEQNAYRFAARWAYEELKSHKQQLEHQSELLAEYAQQPPAQDELQVLLERVTKFADAYRGASFNEYRQVQQWIEDALKARPQKVEGGGL